MAWKPQIPPAHPAFEAVSDCSKAMGVLSDATPRFVAFVYSQCEKLCVNVFSSFGKNNMTTSGSLIYCIHLFPNRPGKPKAIALQMTPFQDPFLRSIKWFLLSMSEVSSAFAKTRRNSILPTPSRQLRVTPAASLAAPVPPSAGALLALPCVRPGQKAHVGWINPWAILNENWEETPKALEF